jgi:cell division protein FtsI/penicillin-binding protein 2
VKILHTLYVIRFIYGAVLTCAGFVWTATSVAQQSGGWAGSIERAAQSAQNVRIAVLDAQSGRVLASHRLHDLARTLAAPGSTLKPILLYQSLQAGLWSADRTVACQKNLAIREHRLACSHPLSPPFKAREALAWSCNTYFAEMAHAIPPPRMEQMLRPTGLLGATGLTRNEILAEFHPPQTVEEVELGVLGVEGIRVTPLELAVAYRWLALRMMADRNSIATETVMGGLSDSVTFGIAGQAYSGGVSVAGKTGTAESVGSTQTHGWFVGLAPALNPEIVIVVYLPVGRGVDAAHIAGLVLGNSPMARK